MPNDINELDVQDVGLKMVMGSRFEDETVEAPKKKTVEMPTAKPVQKFKKEVSRDAQWEPAPAEPSFTQNLMSCAKKAWIYAVMSWVFFYWEQAGMMDASAARICMFGCAVLLGCTYGRVFMKELS